MTEEQEPQVGTNEPEVGTEVQTDPFAQEAMELGWQPEEDFRADPKNEGKPWRSAKEFLDRKPLFDKIDDVTRRLKQTEKALASLSEQSRRAEQIGYDRALAELRVMKKTALEEGDADKVIAIDEQIVDLKNIQRNSPPPPQGPPPEFVEWVGRNDWYRTDSKLRAAADGIGMQYIKAGLPPAEVLANVERDLKELFPVKFDKARPKAPPSVESGARKTNGTGSGPETVKGRMSGDELRIMKTIIGTGLTEAEYLKQFVETQPERFKGVKL